MSVVSKNPFDLLGEDGDESPAPAPKPAAKKADAPAAPARAVPGAAGNAPKPANNAGGARGGRAPRGAPRNNYRNEGDRNTGPTSSEGVAEGMETPGGFDGERVPNSRKSNHIRDAHTKGPRSERPVKNVTSGGHTANRGAGAGGNRVPVGGGERRQFERRSGGLPDSQKKVDQGWGANEGGAELDAEVQGEADAVVEENTPETPAPEAEGEAADAAPVEPVEPEEIQKGLDEYLAERAAAAVSFGKKEGRQVTAETLEGQEFRRAGVDEFYAPKEKTASKTPKASAKKEKVFIAVDGQFATPPGGAPSNRGSDRPNRGGDRAERGGAGAGRGGERSDRGSGERGGRGRGGPRGARGGARGGNAAGRGGARSGNNAGGANLDSNDQTAFPALGA